MTPATAKMRRVKGVVTIALAASALAVPAQGAAAVTVWFARDGRVVPVHRNVSSIKAAVRTLLAGPTAKERARGIRSALPASVPLLDLSIERRVVSVDLGARLAAGRDDSSLRLRVSQLVRTVSSFPGVAGVRILVDGGVPVGLFPGLDLHRPLTAGAVPSYVGPSVRDLQQLLSDLGYMAAGGVTGAVDGRTEVAVIAFQKWSGLPRNGVLDAATTGALLRATRPEPMYSGGTGRRVEVLLQRQVALLIEDGKVEHVVHISTGAAGRSTPAGSFRVYRKERYSWSVPFKVWMPWASYFTGGIAFHEYASVPTYPASHGCVRVNHYDALELYDFAAQGTPVRVLW
jgi:lipoprotein-anchoring transpeptidase ErfK/SrfK